MQVHVLPPQCEAAGAVTRMNAARAEQQRAVTPDRTAPTQHVEVGVRLEPGDVALHADRSGQRAAQRKVRDPAGQAVERERIGADIGEDAEYFRAGVETDDAADETDRPHAIVMTQRAAEHRVLQRPGERARGVELPLKIESGDESPDRADVDPAGCYGERLERQPRLISPFPRIWLSGHPGTSESRNDHAVSIFKALTGPSTIVCPVRRP